MICIVAVRSGATKPYIPPGPRDLSAGAPKPPRKSLETGAGRRRLTGRKVPLAHYPGWYRIRDAGRIDPLYDGWIMGRIDDVMNITGHRFLAAATEEIMASHPDVAECAVVGTANDSKGQVPLGLVVMREGVSYHWLT